MSLSRFCVLNWLAFVSLGCVHVRSHDAVPCEVYETVSGSFLMLAREDEIGRAHV